MSLLPSGGRSFSSSSCYALLSRNAQVIDLSYGMRDLCRRFRPREETPSSFRTLLVERDQPVLLEHLERVWAKQESNLLDVQLVRPSGAPLDAQIFSVPAPREKAVQSFLAVNGLEGSDVCKVSNHAGHHRASDGSVGFMILRTDGDYHRLIVSFCDAQLRSLIGMPGSDALTDSSIYQIFTPEACRKMVEAVRHARLSGEPRRCAFAGKAGRLLHAVVFVANGSIMLLAERDSADSGTSDAAPVGESRYPVSGELERFVGEELRPGLRALRNLARSIEVALPEDSEGRRRVQVMEQLSSQIFDAVEEIEGHRGKRVGLTEEEDVLRLLVEGVRDIAHPALAERSRSLAVVDEVPPGTEVLSTYSLNSLQQILVDLLGEAAGAVPHADLECRIRPLEETSGRAVLEFLISARPTRDSTVPPEAKARLEELRSRPMFKASRRYLKALGSELEVELRSGACFYTFELAFGKFSALETA